MASAFLLWSQSSSSHPSKNHRRVTGDNYRACEAQQIESASRVSTLVFFTPYIPPIHHPSPAEFHGDIFINASILRPASPMKHTCNRLVRPHPIRNGYSVTCRLALSWSYQLSRPRLDASSPNASTIIYHRHVSLVRIRKLVSLYVPCQTEVRRRRPTHFFSTSDSAHPRHYVVCSLTVCDLLRTPSSNDYSESAQQTSDTT